MDRFSNIHFRFCNVHEFGNHNLIPSDKNFNSQCRFGLDTIPVSVRKINPNGVSVPNEILAATFDNF